ncbi:MAG: DsrE family protein [Thiohalomonadaceae bacterium]
MLQLADVHRPQKTWFIHTCLILVSTCLLLALAAPQARADGVAKVVFHADFADPRRFSAMLTSINNMVNYYEDNLMEYDVRIVFVAHGIRFVTDDKLVDTPFAEDKALAGQRENLRGRLLSLADTRGVKLELCNITRSQIGLVEDKLYSGVQLVPSGVAQLAGLQQEEGFAYLKIE